MLIRVLLACFLMIPWLATADTRVISAADLLEKMQLAMRTLNYQGTVVFLKNGQIDTMKYQHTLLNGLEQEQLTSLNSPLREISRQDNQVSCLFKDSKHKVINHHPIDSSLLINLPANISKLAQNYLIGLADTNEAIAMQTSQIVTIYPYDQLRYAHKIWISEQWHLPLKAETYANNGDVLEQIVFTDLQVDPSKLINPAKIDDQQLDIKHIHSAISLGYEQAPIVLKNWPAGFETVFFIPNSMQKHNKSVDHLLISDGLASVSVYIEAKTNAGITGFHNLGSVHSFSKVIGDHQITVLGEVPASTVELIADGIVLH